MKSFKEFFEDVDTSEGQPQSKLEIARQRFAAIKDKAKEILSARFSTFKGSAKNPVFPSIIVSDAPP